MGRAQVVVTHRISDAPRWPSDMHTGRVYSIVGDRVRVSTSMVVEGNKSGAIQDSGPRPVPAIVG